MKATNWKLFGSIAVAMLMIVGCSAPVHVEKDDTVDFSRYKTFAWVDKDGPGKKTGIKVMTSWNKSLKRPLQMHSTNRDGEWTIADRMF